MHDTIYDEVREALNEYNVVAPYWFVSAYDVTTGEGASQHFFDYWALFQAKALILQESGAELVKYLDVPAVQVGDLYYIQNLVAVLDAGLELESGLSKTGSATAAELGEVVTYSLSFSGYTGTLTITDTLPLGLSAPEFLASEGTTVSPIYEDDSRQITWRFTDLAEEEIVLRYRVTVTTDQSAILSNRAELITLDGERSTASFTIIANPRRAFLPLIMRNW